MDQKILEKLEWPLLLSNLAGYCHTEDAQNLTRALRPTLSRHEIEANWHEVEPLKTLVRQGYRAPIGAILPIAGILKAASLGQILEGGDLRAISLLLEAVRKITTFAQDLAPRCPTLARIKGHLYPLSSLAKAIDKAIDPNGQLNDEASPELGNIRRQKRSLSRRIEQKLAQILSDPAWDLYLQDNFFTVRSERYVVPIKLDGRGRVAGTICDTSDSGQTLFIEPTAIAAMNQSLAELELSEKLEIIKIFRELTRRVCEERDVLEADYAELVRLDFWSAQAQLADQLDAGTIGLFDDARIDLREARHPLVRSPHGRAVTPNDISLAREQSVLIISGPNAGGKTVVLKTVGILLLMAKAGLLVPADARSELGLFERLFIEMGDAQSLTANLSTFSGHIEGLKPILEKASSNDLVLLDELAVGTEPHTGSAIAQAILEELVDKRVTALVTTHYDNLKSLAVGDQRFRNASMEYSLSSFKPTYRLILDVPGQGYGLEVAAQTGLSKAIIKRAQELRGDNVSSLDAAVSQLMLAREEAAAAQAAMRQATSEAEAEKVRWQQEVDLLKKTRQQVAEKLKAKYEKELAKFKESLNELTEKMRQTYREAQKSAPSELDEHRQGSLSERDEARSKMRSYQETLTDLSRQFQGQETLPGRRVVSTGELRLNDRVYIVALKQEGRVTRTAQSANERVEVEAGKLKLKLAAKDLRLIASNTSVKDLQRKNKAPRPAEPEASRLEMFIQTPANTVDLRGLDVDEALARTWKFIDAAVMRGETGAVLVHGHGTAALKSAIRAALSEQHPYDLKFQAGDRSQGGDGVTLVYFDR